jgi:hypothetical protein
LPLPPLGEANAQTEFEAVEITPDEFESAWFRLEIQIETPPNFWRSKSI